MLNTLKFKKFQSVWFGWLTFDAFEHLSAPRWAPIFMCSVFNKTLSLRTAAFRW